MDFFTSTFVQLKQMNKRELLTQGINLGASCHRCQPPTPPPIHHPAALSLPWLRMRELVQAPVATPTCVAHAGLIVSSALMLWKTLIFMTGSESPVRTLPEQASR